METINRQLEEILSWRFVTEFWRRFPQRFTLIEAHPGGGQYDCLVLMTKGQDPEFAIDVNRGGGSVHIHKKAFGLDDDMLLYSDWVDRMLRSSPDNFLEDVAHKAGLVPPNKLPTSTPETIVYRFISDFLTHSVGRRERWECRNGYEDTSGYGGGKRDYLFEKFPSLGKVDNLRNITQLLGEYAYNYWFLIKNDDPILCLDTNGEVYRQDGIRYNLTNLYKYKRRIWPLIFEVGRDILP